jgi:hypothetical protein
MPIMRDLRPLLFLVLGLALSAQAALAGEPVLTILFTGNTEGNSAPCPS